MIRRPHRHPRSAIDRRPAVDRSARLDTYEFGRRNPDRVHVFAYYVLDPSSRVRGGGTWGIWRGTTRIAGRGSFAEAIAFADRFARGLEAAD